MIPTPSDLRQMLRRLDGEPADSLESDFVEFKSWDPHPARRDSFMRTIRETVVAFANAAGGAIVIGVVDRQRSRKASIQDVQALDPTELRRSIYSGTAPPVLVDVDELIEPEGRLLVVRVPRGLPPHTTSEGVGKIRVAGENHPLTGDALARLYLSGGRDLSAEIVPDARADDLDPDQIRRVQRAIEAEGTRPELAKLPPGELLANLHLADGDRVTLGAVLLLGRGTALARWAPQHEVIFLRYRNDTTYEARHEFRGPLLEVLATVERLLATHLSLTTVDAAGFQELSLPDLTSWSAREAILNALVHRDYFMRQSVMVEIHRKHVLVSSPGGFVGGVSPANLLRHPPVRRNPLLASVMQTLGFVNRAGIGVDRICKEHLRLGKPMPRWEADESHVALKLARASHSDFARFVAEESRAGRVLELNDLIALRGVTERGSLDRWSAADRLQLPEDTAADLLAELRGRGYLVAHGRGRGTSYRLARNLAGVLRGPVDSGRDLALDDEAVRLRVQALLAERGRLSNDDVRRLSDYSRTQVLRLMRELREAGLAEVRGRGRGAHYVPGPKLPAPAPARRR